MGVCALSASPWAWGCWPGALSRRGSPGYEGNPTWVLAVPLGGRASAALGVCHLLAVVSFTTVGVTRLHDN